MKVSGRWILVLLPMLLMTYLFWKVFHPGLISMKQAVKLAEKQAVKPAVKPQNCIRTYESLFRHDELDFRVVFGYKDGRPARFVGDRYERNHFVQRVLEMGFERAPDDDELFHLQIELNGKPKHISLRVVGSAASPDDDENRRDPFQEWKSENARSTFLEGLKTADVIFYDGHSRDGGGPDFESPRCLANRHVNYPWYRKNRPGFHQMVNALQETVPDGIEAGAPKRLIGLFSCDSDRHFSRRILQDKRVGLVSTQTLIYYADAFEALTQALENLIHLKCEKEFTPAHSRVHHLWNE